MPLNLVSHVEVRIASTSERIWPHILHPNSWKKGALLERSHGPEGACGEVFRAFAQGSKEPMYLVQNIELIPRRRRTIKLFQVHGGALIGFASWLLTQHNGATSVAYDVYTEYQQATETVSSLDASELASLEADNARLQCLRFQEELTQLKQLVEGG